MLLEHALKTESNTIRIALLEEVAHVEGDRAARFKNSDSDRLINIIAKNPQKAFAELPTKPAILINPAPLFLHTGLV